MYPSSITLDLNFQGISETIASYLIPHARGAILIESGPGSTLPNLEKALAEHGYALPDVTDILLTHIHLDHAGAAGYLARQGARIYVHEFGAQHLLNPEKLLKSATRIYGDLMDALWGEFLSVPEENLVPLQGDGEIEIHGIPIRHLDTPGHARHHLSWIVDDICFTGDVGGVRLPGPRYMRLPSPPPEFHIETWRETILKFRAAGFKRIAPTHFGIFDDVDWHLDALESVLDDVERWMEATLPHISEREALYQPFNEWELSRCAAAGLDEASLHAYSLAMPVGMGADGIWRYWHKFRVTSS